MNQDPTSGYRALPNPPTTIAIYRDSCGGEWDIRSYARGGFDASQINGQGLSPGFDTIAAVCAHLDREASPVHGCGQPACEDGSDPCCSCIETMIDPHGRIE